MDATCSSQQLPSQARQDQGSTRQSVNMLALGSPTFCRTFFAGPGHHSFSAMHDLPLCIRAGRSTALGHASAGPLSQHLNPVHCKVYAATLTELVEYPLAAAIACTVVVLVIANGPVYRGEFSDGVVPSIVK